MLYRLFEPVPFVLTPQQPDFQADFFRHILQIIQQNLKKQVPIGQSDVDWKDFFEAAKVGGIKNVFVKMDPNTFGPSAEYLKKLL